MFPTARSRTLLHARISLPNLLSGGSKRQDILKPITNPRQLFPFCDAVCRGISTNIAFAGWYYKKENQSQLRRKRSADRSLNHRSKGKTGKVFGRRVNKALIILPCRHSRAVFACILICIRSERANRRGSESLTRHSTNQKEKKKRPLQKSLLSQKYN